jgi:hypothetical protein
VKLVAIAAVLAACVDAPHTTGPHGESHVISFDHPAWLPRKVDILFAIDGSIAMTPYVERTRAVPPALVAGLQRTMGGVPDLHVGVVTGGTPLGAFLVDTQHVDGTRSGNFDGSLVAAIAAQIDVGASGNVTPRLFDAVRDVVDTNPGGFLRDGAELVLVSLAAKDDMSSGFPPDYAVELEASKPSIDQTLGIGIYPTSSPRLSQFHAALHHPRVVSIDAPDYASAFGTVGCETCAAPATPCIAAPADIDLETEGAQYDCAIVSVDADGTEHLLRQCTDASQASCWTIERDALHCFSHEPVVVRVRGYAPPFRPHLRGQCVVF